MATQRKTTTRKPASKTPASQVKPTEEAVEVAVKPEVKRKKQIDRDLMVSCKNVTDGKLIYVSRKTGLQTIWMSYGDIEFIDVGELLTMKASQPAFLNKPWLVIEDEDVVEYLGLKHLYAQIVDTEDLDSFFAKSHEEISEIVEKIPQGTKDSIGIRARKMIEDGSLYDTRKIKVLEEKLKIDLSILTK